MVSGRMIGNAKEFGGIYFLEDDHLSQPTTTLCLNSVSDKVMIWHYRLRHPNFYYLRYLLPNLFKNKSPSSYHCEFCELAKYHRSFFPPQKYKASKPFSLIHSDVWGPSRVSTFSGKRWFVTFIDDHTRLCWEFLLKDKSEVKNVFQSFYAMVKTQFGVKIEVFRTDNGGEFFSD